MEEKAQRRQYLGALSLSCYLKSTPKAFPNTFLVATVVSWTLGCLFFVFLSIPREFSSRSSFPLSHVYRITDNSSSRSRQWLFIMEKMEINGRNPDLKGNGNHSSGDSNIKSNEMPTFVNHAEIAWHERRREWVGDCSGNMQQVPMEPILSWTTTYEDLLSTAEPFQQPIPLAEMVDFLVDIWHEDDLYD